MRNRGCRRRRAGLSGFPTESSRRTLAASLAVALAGVVALSGLPPASAAPPSGPAFNPVSGNQGFLVFVEGHTSLNTNASEGPVALGGDLAISDLNFALGRPIVANSTSGTLVASNANDGNPNTYWQGVPGTLPHTLTVDLGVTRNANEIHLRLPSSFPTRTQTLSIQGSVDGSTYGTVLGSATYTFNPATGNEVEIGFPPANVRFFRLTITANSAVAAGQIGELEIFPPSGGQGNTYLVASQTPGTFTAPGDAQPTGLLIGGAINWDVSASNGYVNVQNNGYVKLGDTTGTTVFQRPGSPTHLVVGGGSYNSTPGVSLALPQPTASVTQSGLVDFAGAFSTFRTRSSELAVCTNTVVLRDSSGTPLPSTIPPGTNAYLSLTGGTQNVLNITAANLANIASLNFQNLPNATTPLIVNVSTGGIGNLFNWTPPSVSGLSTADAGYVMWNFATATRVTLTGNSPVYGTVYAPSAGLYQQDSGGINGNVISASYAQGGPGGSPSGGTIRNVPFATTIQSCGAPILTINKTADVTSATPGSVVRYTITVTNAGGTPYTGATFSDVLTDVLDDATYNNDAAATTGTVSFTSPSLTWTGNLPLDTSATITYSVTVRNPDTGNHRLVNTVTSATTGSNCAAGSGDAQCTANVPVAELVLDKAVNTSTVTPGGTVDYTVTLTNAGQTAYTGITVADNLSGALDDATYNNDAAASAGTVSFTSPNLNWTGDVAVGATVTITFSMTVNDPDTGDNALINVLTSTAAGNNCPAGGTDARCRETVGVLVPGLTITKTADTAAVPDGSVVNYTITIVNTGQTPYPGAVVTDDLTDVLDDAGYNNDATATAGTVNFTSPNLTWTGDLAVGAPTVTITYSVTAGAHEPEEEGNHDMINVVSTNAPGSNCPVGSTDPRCRLDVDIAELEIEFTSTPNVASPGAVLRFDATFTNLGQVPYTGITISLPRAGIRDDATANGDQTATSGVLTLTATALDWTGDVPVGGSVAVTGTVTVNNPDTGNRLIEAVLSTTAPGSNCPPGSTDPRCGIAVPVQVSELTIVKRADAPAAVPGNTLHYTVTLTNSGNTAYPGATVTDDLAAVVDEATYNNDASATSGSLNYTAPTLTWTGALAVGQVATITYSVTVNAAEAGDNLLVNRVTSTAAGSTCPPASGNPDCVRTIPVLVSRLTVEKTADVTAVVPGGVVAYTLTITNNGRLPYSGAEVTDQLTGVLDDADYNGNATASAGTVSYSAPNLTWTGDLAVGATVTVSYSVTVQNPDTGDQQLTNTVVSAEAGSNCPSGGTDPRCAESVPVLNATTLTFAKTANRTATAHGQTIDFTVTVSNSGLIPYIGATFTDSLADALDDAVYNGDAAASSGVLTYLEPELIWVGDVPAGGTVTITYTMTVRTGDVPGSDDHVENTISSLSVGSNCPAGSTDPRCFLDIPVVHLEIVNTAEPATSTTPGSVVRLNVTITNDSPIPQFGVVVTNDPTDVTDDATPTGDQTATSGSLVLTPQGVTWTGDIDPGETILITGTVTVNNPDTGNRVLRGQIVSTSLGSSCPPGSTDPNCGVEVIVLVSELTISKVADRPVALQGSTVNYTVTVTNSGNTAYTGASVADDLSGVLDDATYNNDATAGAGSLAYTAPTLTWTGDLAVGQVVIITFSVTVNNPDTGDHAMVNRVTSTDAGSSCPPASGAAGCTAAVGILEPRLTIVKSADVTGTAPGGVVEYTLTITNNGQLPYSGAEVTDQLTGVLDDADYNGDAIASTGTVGLTGANLTWIGNLAVGASATVTYSVTVDNPVTGDGQLGNTVVSTAAGNNCPSGSSDPRCTTNLPVSILIVTNIADVATTTPGGVVNYTVTISNTGQTAYTGTTVTDALADALDDASYNGDATASAGSVAFNVADGTLSWTGSLALGATVTITASVTVNDPDTGDTELTTVLSSAATGNNCPTGSTDPRCTSVVDVLIPVLSIAKSTDVSVVIPGGTVQYTVTVNNSGETPYDDAVVTDSLDEVLDDATYNGDATATSGTMSFSTPNLTWTGDLAVGATATITYSVTVNDPYLGDGGLENTVTSTEPGSNCLPTRANGACMATVAVLIPELTISKSTDATGVFPGDTVQYTVTIANTGQFPYQGIAVTDALAEVLEEADYNGDATASDGAIALDGTTLTWTGDLAVDAVVFVRYSVTVHDPETGDGTMVNTVTSAAPGNNCPTGSTDPLCSTTVTVLTPAVDISIAADVATIVEGGTVHYTIDLDNIGEAPYLGLVLTNSLAGVLDDATYNNDATATVGTVEVSGDALTWTGDLGVGEDATITYSVTVDVPADGDQGLVNVVSSTAPGSSCPPPGSAAGCTATTAIVERFLTLTDLTPSFTLTGSPDSTAGQNGAVTMTVTTNSPTGYQVSAQATATELVNTTPGSDDTIPIGNLRVRETGTTDFQSLSATTPVVVHSQGTPSIPEGDPLSNDYQLTVPLDITVGDYVGTIEYVAIVP